MATCHYSARELCVVAAITADSKTEPFRMGQKVLERCVGYAETAPTVA